MLTQHKNVDNYVYLLNSPFISVSETVACGPTKAVASYYLVETVYPDALYKHAVAHCFELLSVIWEVPGSVSQQVATMIVYLSKELKPCLVYPNCFDRNLVLANCGCNKHDLDENLAIILVDVAILVK